MQYASGVRPIETLEKIAANVEAIAGFSWRALLVGAVSLAILILYPKVEKRIPPSLIAVLVGALLVQVVPGLDARVYTIGELYTIPAGLPPFALTDIPFSPDKLLALLLDAITIAVLAAIESLLSCVVANGMSEYKEFAHTVKTAPKFDTLVMVVTFLLTVLLDLVVAIAVGMALWLLGQLAVKVRRRHGEK